MNIHMAIAAFGLLAGAVPASAADGGMERVMSCQGPDAAMEIYLPEAILTGAIATPPRIEGFYVLDLSAAHKGKHLEPVHIGVSADHKFLIVDQYTRGLPVTRIPIGGGTVDFDNRFGSKAVCRPYNAQ